MKIGSGRTRIVHRAANKGDIKMHIKFSLKDKLNRMSGKSKRRWKNNIKMELKATGCNNMD
jgi:hypothetical protein